MTPPELPLRAEAERSVDEAARIARQGEGKRWLGAESYTPIEQEYFNQTTAPLAACDACGLIWIHPRTDIIDRGEFACPRCGIFGCGPLYREEEPTDHLSDAWHPVEQEEER